MEQHEKLNLLKSKIKELNRLVVAFSGGVDSTFLLKISRDVLHDNVIAVTARSPMHPEWEFREAVDFIKTLGVAHKIIELDSSDLNTFSHNPPERCYLCKKEIFKRIIDVAHQNNIEYVADGSNLDDLNDYRPGARAIAELGVISPLKDSGLSKNDIRFLSKEMGLTTWDKPAFACLASRIPYGQEITVEKLHMIDKAEQYLMDLGFKQLRVRHHGEVARIEVVPEDRIRFMDEKLMDSVCSRFKELGFLYTSLDLKGYRMGSMNEAIK